MELKNKENIFFLLFLFLPISIIVGSTISLANLIIIEIFFLIILISKRDYVFINNSAVKLLILLYLYLIFNSFISLDYSIGLARNIGFIRIILLFIFINYFFFYIKNNKKIFDYWCILFLIFIFDVFIEFFFGTNLFGWGAIEKNGVSQPYGTRIVGFFKDEPVAGAFISGFILFLFGHLLIKYKEKKIIPLFFIIIGFIGLLITGERANTIKILFGILIFFFLIDFIKFKTKALILIVFSLIFSIFINQSDYLKNRYIGQVYNKINSLDNLKNLSDQIIYFELYKSGFSVFKNYPLFGVGNKNYRIETCTDSPKKNKTNYLCNTHPHQIYFEILAEHGFVGSIILLGILFLLMFKILKNIINSKNYIQIGTFIYVLINFIPLIPGGAFFSDFNSNLFWINFSIMFAISSKTNIFARQIRT
tara:strand:+ start:387 stop:1649 length:1263 start_codon:yes stop_codon:yes gene_type:complete